MSKHHYAGVDVTIKDDVILHELMWEGRRVEYERVRNSNKMYDSLDPLFKEALIARMRHVLAVMSDNVEQWLPDSFALQQDSSTIRMEFDVLMESIDEDIVDKYDMTSDMFDSARHELIGILEKWNESEDGEA